MNCGDKNLAKNTLQNIALPYRVYKHAIMPVSIILTVAFAYAIYINRDVESLSLPIIILGRIFLTIPVLYFFYEYKKREFTYYRNLGLSRWRLLTNVALIDITIAVIILILSYAILR